MLEGPFMPIEQRTEPFMRIGRRPQAPGVPEGEHKDVDDFQPLANPEAGLAKIHLGLLAGVRLKPHRRHGRPRPIGPERLNRPLHLLIGPRESQRLQFPMEHPAVPIHFRAAALQKAPIGIDLTGAVSRWAGTPAPQPLPPLHGIAGHTELPRNGFDRLAAL